MKLLKTTLLNGISVVVRLFSSLALNKIMAVYVGPSGYAVVGQFQNIVLLASNLSGGLLVSGVTKMTAEHFDSTSNQEAVWRTAVKYSLAISFLIAVSILTIGYKFSDWLFRGIDLGGIYIWLAISLPALALNNILLAVINGKKEIGVYVLSNILGSLLGLFIAGLLISYFGLDGALVACAINPALVLITTVWLVRRCDWFRFSCFFGPAKREALKELASFGLMGLTSTLCGPIVSILIRDHLIDSFGLTNAGYWQAVTKISENYLMLIVSTLSVYYLPRLGEIRKASELKSEIIKVYSLVMPIVIIGGGFIYLLRDFLIRVLFAPEFIGMGQLMAWQITGDVIKIGAWVLSFVLAGRAMVSAFVVTEILFSMTYFLMTLILTDLFGLEGVVMAYALNYLIYWICMGYLINGELNRMKNV